MAMQFSGDLDALYVIRRKHNTGFVLCFFLLLILSVHTPLLCDSA